MSATFKNAKKLVKQEQLRKMMKEHKKVLKEVKKIDSPLAKYNDLGQLTCILCKSTVKSESIWVVHINSKQHKQNIEAAKQLKEKTHNFTSAAKRPLDSVNEEPVKKLKGILKTSKGGEDEPKIVAPAPKKKKQTIVATVPVQEVAMSNEGELPEGFFDDPVQDAKARNQEYKDPLESEWEKFVKEMKSVEHESEAIIAEDQDEATAERHMDEIDEQMALFNRVLDLDKKKDEAIELLNKLKQEPREEEEIDEDIEEFLDWRQKKTF